MNAAAQKSGGGIISIADNVDDASDCSCVETLENVDPCLTPFASILNLRLVSSKAGNNNITVGDYALSSGP